MTMQKGKIDRNINIFRDYLELGSFAEVGKKNNVTEGIARDATCNVWATIRRMIRRNRLQPPKSDQRRDMLKEKQYWLEMLKIYLTSIGK